MAKYKSAHQFGVFPWRISKGNTREVMLLTSRETHRWVIPKGWPMKGRKPPEIAAQEAYEEAGLIGRVVNKRPLGNYHYEKQLLL
jgi:8-oxo-dGTP pyrophosphatase MutT (NUDIX family)